MRVLGMVACLLVLAGRAQAAPAELGDWLTPDKTSVISIFTCGDGICGRITGITRDHPDDPLPRDKWGRAQCGETILQMPGRNADGRWSGHILNPNTGKNWSVILWRVGDVLHLRGYLMLPLFGATQDWSPFLGRFAAGCIYHP